MILEVFKDFSKYLKVPYLDKGRDLRGWDCYGLYRFVLGQRLGIMLPSYDDAYSSANDAAAAAAAARRIVPAGWVLLGPDDTPREGDGVVFRIGGEPWHCGYVIEPGIMLHARKGCGTVLESYTGILWNKRLEGTYRCKL